MMLPPPSRKPKNAAELLADAEEEAGGDKVLDGTNLDVKQLRKLVLSFERRYAANQAARMKHADEPEKFVDSEVDLDEEVKRLGALAGYPNLYPEFVRLNAVPSILGLLSHENPDIAADAVELLHELTDADAVESNEQGGVALVASIVENSGYELIAQCLTRFGGAVQVVDP
jgi:beta-catenin-like protein 1